jgi:hypothetical protein
MGLLSNLFDPGRGDRSNASAIANSPGAQITGAQFNAPFGMSGSFGFIGPHQKFTMQGSLGDFNPVASRLVNTAKRRVGNTALDMGFMDPIFSAAMRDLGDPRLNSIGNMGEFRGLGRMFQSAMPFANADPFELGAGVTERLRAAALPDNQRLVNSTMDRLFASGRLGTTGGANVAGALQESLDQQDLAFQQAGLDFGRALQSDAVGRAMTAFGGREALAGRMFGESLAGAQLQGQNALSRFGMGTSMADALLQNLVAGHNIGISSLGAATGLAQLPLAFQQMALQANIARSNANLARAGVQQNNAAMAKSPLLEGINAIGQFFEPIKFPGTGGSEGG